MITTFINWIQIKLVILSCTKNILNTDEQGVKFVLQQEVYNGDSYVELEKVVRISKNILGIEEEQVRSSIVKMTVDEIIIVEKDEDMTKVYIKEYFMAESDIARNLYLLQKTAMSQAEKCVFVASYIFFAETTLMR